MSTYDKWLFLTKSMMKTIKVDQNNIAASDEYGDMPEENEEELQPLQRFRPQPRVLNQWTRVAMGLRGAGPYFRHSM